jgi:hypothetical protein
MIFVINELSESLKQSAGQERTRASVRNHGVSAQVIDWNMDARG